MTALGTPRELRPIAEQVLAWVAGERKQLGQMVSGTPHEQMLRKIELCALATIEAAMFHDLYGGMPDATSAQVQDER